MCNAHRLVRVVGALVAAILVFSVTPAEAAGGNSTICKGFKGCVNEERSHAGYGAEYRQSFWNMRAGHNCTNYVAYRLTHGRLVARPPGANDAGSWGAAARAAGAKVSRSPRVGSVAWWKPKYNGASSLGHVAYVEAVKSDGSIVVSEDNLRGQFMWRKLVKSGGAWPSGFIEFNESNGSPSGALLWATGTAGGVLSLSGTSNEPDVGAGDRTYLVTVGGPREAAGVESFEFTTPFFRFIRTKTLKTRGTAEVYIYAINTPGTAGADALLGQSTVTIL